ncbi:MAG: methyltransferase, partial [Elusimicrobia bacterium]|nr:methyltransferase [Elusimicrobiota bacterium]MBD3412554.1 methyltransferase [Elusimicrobiota bacterium]
VFIAPGYAGNHGFIGNSSVEDIERTVRDNPDAKVLVLTNPVCCGISYKDLSRIIDYAHRYGLKVHVDETWAYHYGFSSLVPPSAVHLGADYVIHSTIDTLSSFGQGTMIHINDDEFNSTIIDKYCMSDITMRSSCTTLAAIDACRSELGQYGRHLADRIYQLNGLIRQKIKKVKKVTVMDEELIGHDDKDFVLDPAQVVLEISETGLTGEEMAEKLKKEYHINIAFAGKTYLIILLTIETTVNDINDLISALSKISKSVAQEKRAVPYIPRLPFTPNTTVLNPYWASQCETEELELSLAENRYAGEMVVYSSLLITVVVPGEEITRETIICLHEAAHNGIHITGLYKKNKGNGERWYINVIKTDGIVYVPGAQKQLATAADIYAEKILENCDKYEKLIQSLVINKEHAYENFLKAINLMPGYLPAYYNLWSMLNFYFMSIAINADQQKSVSKKAYIKSQLESDSFLNTLCQKGGIKLQEIGPLLLRLSQTQYIKNLAKYPRISGTQGTMVSVFKINHTVYREIQGILYPILSTIWEMYGQGNQAAKDFIETLFINPKHIITLWKEFLKDDKASYIIHYAPDMNQKYILDRYAEAKDSPKKPFVTHLRMLGAVTDARNRLMQDVRDQNALAIGKDELYADHQKEKAARKRAERIVSHNGTIVTANKRDEISGPSVDTVFLNTVLHTFVYANAALRDTIKAVFDVGVGSGFLLTSMAMNLPRLERIEGNDVLKAAQTITHKNVTRAMRLNNIDESAFSGIVLGEDSLNDFVKHARQGKRFDLIVSNPPYLPDQKDDYETHSKPNFYGYKDLKVMKNIFNSLHILLNRNGLCFMVYSNIAQPYV